MASLVVLIALVNYITTPSVWVSPNADREVRALLTPLLSPSEALGAPDQRFLETSVVVDRSTTGADSAGFGGRSVDEVADQRTQGNGMDRSHHLTKVIVDTGCGESRLAVKDVPTFRRCSCPESDAPLDALSPRGNVLATVTK